MCLQLFVLAAIYAKQCRTTIPSHCLISWVSRPPAMRKWAFTRLDYFFVLTAHGIVLCCPVYSPMLSLLASLYPCILASAAGRTNESQWNRPKVPGCRVEKIQRQQRRQGWCRNQIRFQISEGILLLLPSVTPRRVVRSMMLCCCLPQSKTKFTIEHYAGAVTYTSKGFIEKNEDKLHSNQVRVFLHRMIATPSSCVCLITTGVASFRSNLWPHQPTRW